MILQILMGLLKKGEKRGACNLIIHRAMESATCEKNKRNVINNQAQSNRHNL